MSDAERMASGAAGVREGAARLCTARVAALVEQGARARAALLGRAGARLLDRADPLRREAEERVPEEAGLSPAMARAVIDGMARDWTAERLLGLLTAELHDPDVLDRFVPASPGTPDGLRVRAYPPELSFHIGAGTVPGVSTTTLVRALLVGSAAIVKPGRGDLVLTSLFWRALQREAPALAAMCAVVYWEGGAATELEDAALAEADLVVVYGGDETVRSVRERLPVTTRLVAYHHRSSAAVIGRGALTRSALAATADTAARAVAMFDQRGCVSPQAIFVEDGGESSPRDFAAALGAALERLGSSLPAAPPSPAESSAIHQLRRTAELRAAAGEPVAVHGARAGSWTVVLEPAGRIEACPGLAVRVYAVHDVRDAADHLRSVGPHLQTVGVAGVDGARLAELADALGEIGAIRICPMGEVAFPPAWWHHDGQGPLRALLRWVDLES